MRGLKKNKDLSRNPNRQPSLAGKFFLSAMMHLSCFFSCGMKEQLHTRPAARPHRAVPKTPVGPTKPVKTAAGPAPPADKVPAGPERAAPAPVPLPSTDQANPRQAPNKTPKTARKAFIACANALKAVVVVLAFLTAAVGGAFLGVQTAKSAPAYAPVPSVMSYNNATVAQGVYEGVNSPLSAAAPSAAQQHLLAELYGYESQEATVFTNGIYNVVSEATSAWYDTPCDLAPAPAVGASGAAGAVPSTAAAAETSARFPTVAFATIEAGNFTVMTPQHVAAAPHHRRPVTSAILQLLHQQRYAINVLVSESPTAAHKLATTIVRFSKSMLARVEALRLPAFSSWATTTAYKVNVAAASVYINATCVNQQFKTYKRTSAFKFANEEAPAPSSMRHTQQKGRSIPLNPRRASQLDTVRCNVVQLAAWGVGVPAATRARLGAVMGCSGPTAGHLKSPMPKNRVKTAGGTTARTIVAPWRRGVVPGDPSSRGPYNPVAHIKACGQPNANDGCIKAQQGSYPAAEERFVPTEDLSLTFLVKLIVGCSVVMAGFSLLVVGTVSVVLGPEDSELPPSRPLPPLPPRRARHPPAPVERGHAQPAPVPASFMTTAPAPAPTPVPPAPAPASPAKKAPPSPQEAEKGEELISTAAVVMKDTISGPSASSTASLDRQSSLASSVTAADVSPIRSASPASPASPPATPSSPASFDDGDMEDVAMSVVIPASNNPYALLFSPNHVASIAAVNDGSIEGNDEEEYEFV